MSIFYWKEYNVLVEIAWIWLPKLVIDCLTRTFLDELLGIPHDGWTVDPASKLSYLMSFS